MTDGRRPGSPSPDDVRALVRRIVDTTLARDADAARTAESPKASRPPNSPADSPESSAASVPAGPAAPADAPTAGPAATLGRGSVAIGGDHGGYLLKDTIGEWLRRNGYALTDCGTHSSEAVDYPDIAYAVARLVADGTCRWGIVVDGAGIGSCMAANKVPGVRAALCHDISSARNSREHNHANVLTLGARFIGEGLAIEIVQTWLGTNWGYGRHEGRVNKITEIERRYARPANEVR